MGTSSSESSSTSAGIGRFLPEGHSTVATACEAAKAALATYSGLLVAAIDAPSNDSSIRSARRHLDTAVSELWQALCVTRADFLEKYAFFRQLERIPQFYPLDHPRLARMARDLLDEIVDYLDNQDDI